MSYTNDNLNRLSTAADNRLPSGQNTATYAYDGDGNRVLKSGGGGTGSTYWYAADGSLSGENTVSVNPGNGNPNPTRYFYFDGKLIVNLPYPNPAMVVLPDQIGSTRVTVDTGGNPHDTNYYPYGGYVTAPTDTIEQRFTGKERDTESGNDYFGARYYASTMGRWLSPDRLNLTDDRVLNPANTLNKYVYGGNNPLKYTDLDGKDITIFYENSFLSPPGHIMFLAENQQTGDAAAMSWGPVHDAEYGFTFLGSPVNSTKTFGFPMTTDQLKAEFSSLTIKTSPEDAQEVIDLIRQMSTSINPYTLYGPNAANCTTECRKALQLIKRLTQGSKIWTPSGLWANLFSRYSPSYWKNPFAEYFPDRGADYGNKPENYDTFDLLALLMNGGDTSSVTVTESYSIDCQKYPDACK